MPHWFVVVAVLVLLEAAYQFGKVAQQRKDRYPYTYRCPKKRCEFRINAQTLPTLNWAIYQHEDVHATFKEEI